MAIRQVNDFAEGDVNLTSMMETINKGYKGLSMVTIDEYDTDSAPVVKVGSVFDNNGACILVETADETPTGYSGISNSTIFYLYYDESGEVFIYLSTVPIWNDTFQGWYNGNDRALFSMFKNSGGTLYQNKNLLLTQNNLHLNGNLTVVDNIIAGGIDTDNVLLKHKVVEIGSWNMGVTASGGDQSKSVAHGIADHSKIRSVKAMIIQDGNTTLWVLARYNGVTDNMSGSVDTIGSTYISLRVRVGDNVFDSSDFNDPGINRGNLYIVYEV